MSASHDCRRCPRPCLSTFFVVQELEEQAGSAATGAASDSSKPTLRQRLDWGGPGLGEEQIMQNPLQLHKVGPRITPNAYSVCHAGTVNFLGLHVPLPCFTAE